MTIDQIAFEIAGRIEHHALCAMRCPGGSCTQMTRPSVLYRPTLTFEATGNNNIWLAEYGRCIGTGISPAKTMQTFDDNWTQS